MSHCQLHQKRVYLNEDEAAEDELVLLTELAYEDEAESAGEGEDAEYDSEDDGEFDEA